MLSLGEHHDTGGASAMNPALISVFGLLSQTSVTKPNGPISNRYSLDSFFVEERGDAATLVCKCGRSQPFHLAVVDLERAHRVQGLYACLFAWRSSSRPAAHRIKSRCGSARTARA